MGRLSRHQTQDAGEDRGPARSLCGAAGLVAGIVGKVTELGEAFSSAPEGVWRLDLTFETVTIPPAFVMPSVPEPPATPERRSRHVLESRRIGEDETEPLEFN